MIPGLETPVDRRKQAGLPPAKSLQYLAGKMTSLERRMTSIEMELSLLRIQMEHPEETSS